MGKLLQARTDRAGKALVVDDDPIVRTFICSVLGFSGIDVLEAPDAAQALIAFQAGGCEVDFVITDIWMPGMNGCDLARMLLAGRPSLAVLLVSGLTQDRRRAVLSCRNRSWRRGCWTLSSGCRPMTRGVWTSTASMIGLLRER